MNTRYLTHLTSITCSCILQTMRLTKEKENLSNRSQWPIRANLIKWVLHLLLNCFKNKESILGRSGERLKILLLKRLLLSNLFLLIIIKLCVLMTLKITNVLKSSDLIFYSMRIPDLICLKWTMLRAFQLIRRLIWTLSEICSLIRLSWSTCLLKQRISKWGLIYSNYSIDC